MNLKQKYCVTGLRWQSRNQQQHTERRSQDLSLMDITHKDVNNISSFQRRKAKAGAEENLFYISDNGEVFQVITHVDLPFFHWFKKVKGIRYQIIEEY